MTLSRIVGVVSFGRWLGTVHVVIVAGIKVGTLTSVSTLLLGGAVNELLLADVEQVAAKDAPSTLNGASGHESPAGAALSLVLDRSSVVQVFPIELEGDRGRVELGKITRVVAKKILRFHALIPSQGSFLLDAPVGELVVGHGVGDAFLGVVGTDIGVDLDELGHASIELLLCLGSETVFGHVLRVEPVVVDSGGSGSVDGDNVDGLAEAGNHGSGEN